MSYNYTESGLDNIILVNGYTIHETPYGEGVSIENTEGLHRAIGQWLVELPKPLNGAELRFLRIEMELSQRRLADLIGSTEQNVRRWEKARTKPIPGTADRMVRVLYKEYRGDGRIRDLIDQLAELDQVEPTQVHFCETEDGWRVAA